MVKSSACNGWSAAKTYQDSMHPTPLGRILYSDLLINVLRRAELALAAEPRMVVPRVPTQTLFTNGHQTVWPGTGRRRLRVECDQAIDRSRRDDGRSQ